MPIIDSSVVFFLRPFLGGRKSLLEQFSLTFTFVANSFCFKKQRAGDTPPPPFPNTIYPIFKRIGILEAPFTSEIYQVVLLFSYKNLLLPPRNRNNGLTGLLSEGEMLTLFYKGTPQPALNGSLMIQRRINSQRTGSQNASGDCSLNPNYKSKQNPQKH